MLARFFAIPFSVRLAATLLLALVIGVALRVIVSSPTSGSVVPIYLKAGERWLAQNDLYQPTPGLDVYRNPPGFAALFAQVTEWNPKFVGLLWRWVGLGLFLVGLLRVQQTFYPEMNRTQQGWIVCFALLILLPAFNNGQVNLLLAGTLLHAVAALHQARYWEAAVWFSLGCWLKLYPVAVALLACLLAPRMLPWRLAVLLLVAFACPVLLTSPDYLLQQYASFWHYLGLDDRSLAELRRAPLNWTILPRVWLGWTLTSSVTKAVAVLAGVAAACWIWRQSRQQPTSEVILNLLLLGTMWMTAFGPATEANTYSLWAGVSAVSLVARPAFWSVFGYVLLFGTVARGLFPNDWQWQVLGLQPLGAICLAIPALASRAVQPEITVLAARIRIMPASRSRLESVQQPTQR